MTTRELRVHSGPIVQIDNAQYYGKVGLPGGEIHHDGISHSVRINEPLGLHLDPFEIAVPALDAPWFGQKIESSATLALLHHQLALLGRTPEWPREIIDFGKRLSLRDFCHDLRLRAQN